MRTQITALEREAKDNLSREVARLERTRLADELHDGCFQTLAALNIEAELLASHPGCCCVDKAKAIVSLAERAVRQARAVIESESEHLPVPSSLDQLKKIVSERWDGEFHFDVDETAHLDERQWDAVSYLLREGLNNAKRHAGAVRARFVIERAPGKTMCTLMHDGRLPDAQVAYGYGLTRVAEKIESSGGIFFFGRKDDQCVTSVTFDQPLKAHRRPLPLIH